MSLFWKEASYSFVYFDHLPDLDWDDAYQEFIPQVIESSSTLEYYRTLQRFCALLKDGHTNVYLPASAAAWLDRPSVVLIEIGHRAFVQNVSTALQDTLPLGSEVIAVAGVETARYLEQEVLPYISSSTEHILWSTGISSLLDGPRGSSVSIGLRTPAGEQKEISLKRNRGAFNETWVRELSASKPLVALHWPAERIAQVALNSFADPQAVTQFTALLPELEQCRALIIDIRSNSGGSTSIGKRILDHLTDRRLEGSTWRTREHRGAFKAWGKYAAQDPSLAQYRAYFDDNAWYQGGTDVLDPSPGKKLLRPMAVLIDHATASAAEDFLIYLDKAPNVTRVGRPTYGSTGQPLAFDLPGGGSARVCTKRDTYPDGRDFVGVGVPPDVLVEPTIDDVIHGRDPALARAVALLQEQLKD
ncbi:MAG: S41 family peptidase [Planctomycetota bacterium]